MTLPQSLEAMHAEVCDFHERFALHANPTPLITAARVMSEEAGEALIEACTVQHTDTGQTELADELADVFFTAFGVAVQAGITAEQLAAAITRVTEKNARKQPSNTRRNAHGKVIKE